MAQYASAIQQLSRQQSSMYDEVERVKAQITLMSQSAQTSQRSVEPAPAPANAALSLTQEAFDAFKESFGKDMMRDVSALVRSEVQVSETAVHTKLEHFVAKTIKDRVELTIQNVRTQLLSDMDLRIEELKEDLTSLMSTAAPAAPVPETIAALPPPMQSRAGRIGDIDALSSSIDIEALTKDILGGDAAGTSSTSASAPAVGTVDNDDINFTTNSHSNRKKVLRKTLPSKH